MRLESGFMRIGWGLEVRGLREGIVGGGEVRGRRGGNKSEGR